MMMPRSGRYWCGCCREEGYYVLTGANGVEALALADATKFDLVMLDLNMPVKDRVDDF